MRDDPNARAMGDDEDGPDPTWVRNQPALSTPRRRWWLVPGAILAAVAIGMLVTTLELQTFVPTVGVILVLACYISMLVVAVRIDDPRRRSVTFAWLMAAMTVSALGSLTLVVLGETGF